jgi:anaerobic selenocysteine-containing dehydrogenase
MKPGDETKKIHTVCRIDDGPNCRITAHVKNCKLIKIEPLDFPEPGMRHICGKGLSTIRDVVYHPDRLKYPLLREGNRGEDRWKRISWNEALDVIALNLQKIIDRYGGRAIAFTPGQVWTSALMAIYQRLASALGGTWVNLSGFGDAAGPCADLLSYGIPLGNFYTTDLENPKLCIVWGGNWTVTHPLTWRKIRKLKESGAKLYVIDPRFTATASKADEYISITPGTDTALAIGMMRVIRDEGLIDKDFMRAYTVAPFLVRQDTGLFLREKDLTEGGSDRCLVWDEKNHRTAFPEDAGLPLINASCSPNGIYCKTSFNLLCELLDQFPLNKAAEITGVPADVIYRLAVSYATNRPAVIFRGWGLQRTFHGDLTWRAVTTLAAMTGNIKLQGPQGFNLNREAYTTVQGRSYQYLPLLTLYDAIEYGKPYPVKGLWIAAHNFVNQNPNYNRVLNDLFPKLDFIITVDLFMNASARHSDIVLPACSFYEYMDLIPPFDTVNPYLQLQQKVIDPLYECRTHVDIGNAVGRRMGFENEFRYTQEEYVDMLLSSDHPSMRGVTLERLTHGPVKLQDAYDVPVFMTKSGRIEFYSEKMAPFNQALPIYKEPLESSRCALAKKYPLSLINGHSQYLKCSMFANSSLMRSFAPEPVVEMNPVDASVREIEDGAAVKVFNDRGSVKMRVKIHEGIHPGVVNITQGWWPENYREGTHQALTHDFVNPAQTSAWEPNAAYNDILVEVTKEGARI